MLDDDQGAGDEIISNAGRVIEVKAQNGSNVAYGGTLLQIERSSEAGASAASLEAAIYISSGEGKLLVSGMAVEIVPDHVKRQEHGFMRARVEQAMTDVGLPTSIYNHLPNSLSTGDRQRNSNLSGPTSSSADSVPPRT